MAWEDDSYFPGKSGSPPAEEDTGEVNSAQVPVVPATREEVVPITTPLLPLVSLGSTATTGVPEAVGESALPVGVTEEVTASLSDSEAVSFTSKGTAIQHAPESGISRGREVTPPQPGIEDRFLASDGRVTPLLSETETVPDVLGDLQDAMEVFDSSLSSDGSGGVCRMLLFKLLARASSFTYRDCADLRADLISTCHGLRACGADPSGFEMILSDLLTRAELVEGQVAVPRGQLTDRYSQAVGRVEEFRASLQARVRLQDELIESRDRFSGDLVRTRARMRILEEELASLREHERVVSADMATVEVSLTSSAAALASLEEDLRQAEGDLQSTPAPGSLAEARQRFAIDQQIVREFVAERQI